MNAGIPGRVARGDDFPILARMTTLALLLALAQDPALDFLKKVEDQAAGAKSLRWKMKARVFADAKPLALAIEASFKEGNRARVAAASTDDQNPLSFTFTCDGLQVRAESSKRKSKEAAADPGFAAGLNRILVRGGLFAVNQLNPAATGAALEDGVKVSEAVLSDDKLGDRPVKLLTYQAQIEGKASTIKLWVDPAGLVPLRREVRLRKDPYIDETYEEWNPGAELADELFKGASK